MLNGIRKTMSLTTVTYVKTLVIYVTCVPQKSVALTGRAEGRAVRRF